MKLILRARPSAIAVQQSPRNIAPVMPGLKLNDTGDMVTTLQCWLNRYLRSITVDGIFGPETQFAVRVLQYRMFLPVNGVVTQPVWDALALGMPLGLPILYEGSRGEAVVWVQQVLRGQGMYVPPIDGLFGPVTQTAVRRYQASRRLPMIDGIVGEQTWAALASDRLVSTRWLGNDWLSNDWLSNNGWLGRAG